MSARSLTLLVLAAAFAGLPAQAQEAAPVAATAPVAITPSEAIPSEAVPTRVLVRAVAQDAKVLHDGVGGALITVRDLETGHLLARGVQTGRSGSTDKIMRERYTAGDRHAPVYDVSGTAGYLATLHLDRPTTVEIVAEGPLDFPQAMQRTATTMLVVPGFDVVGEGVVLNLYGFIVALTTPLPELRAEAGGLLPVEARVMMACGCPTEPGGLWDSDDYTILARLVRGGEIVEEMPMAFTGTTSTYAAELPVPPGGTSGLTLEILALDADRANFGRAVHPLPGMDGLH